MANVKWQMANVGWVVGLVALMSGCETVKPTQVLPEHWRELSALPDNHGFAGAFSGMSGDTLIVAGGANFPGKMPWEGGAKVYHDRIFALNHTRGNWREVGRLPRPIAYGVSIPVLNGLLCIGGCDASRGYSDVFLLIWNGRGVDVIDWPALPVTLFNACGTTVGGSIIIAGGEEQPKATRASRRVFALNLRDARTGENPVKWTERAPLPGNGRTLAFASDDGTIMGGVELSPDAQGNPVRRYLNDAYRLGEDGWERLADMPFPLAAGPTPAPVNDRGEVFLLGGDDGSKVGFAPIEKHPGFRDDVLIYNARENQWRVGGKVAAPRATLTAVRWRGGVILPSGEVRPGVRSPKVWWMNFQ